MRSIKFTLPFVVAMVIAIALLAAVGCATNAGPTETRDNSFTVNGTAKLVVQSENGKIEVNAGTDDEVRVQATLRGINAIDYEVSQDGNTITVVAEITGWWSTAGVDITITAPINTDVELATSNGMISLSGIEGTGTLSTSNGNIVLENVKGDFEGSTSNGAIEIDTVEGTGFLRTSNGKLDIQRFTGEVDAQTSNGRISFSGNMTAGVSNRLVTSNGDVDVELLGTPSVNLDASTSNGDITCEFPITATTTSDEHLVGTIGEGEADLYITTSNGDVTIR
jgi:lia operon protein LiaG